MEEVETVEQEVRKISKDEGRKALKKMKNGKAVGPDDTGRGMNVSMREGSGVFDKTVQHNFGP